MCSISLIWWTISLKLKNVKAKSYSSVADVKVVDRYFSNALFSCNIELKYIVFRADLELSLTQEPAKPNSIIIHPHF